MHNNTTELSIDIGIVKHKSCDLEVNVRNRNK